MALARSRVDINSIPDLNTGTVRPSAGCKDSRPVLDADVSSCISRMKLTLVRNIWNTTSQFFPSSCEVSQVYIYI